MVSLQIFGFFQNKKYQKQLQVILDKSKWCLLWVATFSMLTSYITLCEVSWRICPHSRASWVLLTFHFSLFVPLSVCLLCAVQTILPTKFFQFQNCYQKYPLIKTKTASERKIISHNPIKLIASIRTSIDGKRNVWSFGLLLKGWKRSSSSTLPRRTIEQVSEKGGKTIKNDRVFRNGGSKAMVDCRPGNANKRKIDGHW